MGFLKKIVKKVAKGVKKVVKGVGKVVKKVAKGVAKGIDKLGIVGQIGMMFVMPYAMGALGPVWQSFGGFAKTMMGSSNLLYKGIGYAANGIFTAGNMIGSAYKSVTGVIDGAVKGIADTVGLGDAYTNFGNWASNAQNKGAEFAKSLGFGTPTESTVLDSLIKDNYQVFDEDGFNKKLLSNIGSEGVSSETLKNLGMTDLQNYADAFPTISDSPSLLASNQQTFKDGFNVTKLGEIGQGQVKLNVDTLTGGTKDTFLDELGSFVKEEAGNSIKLALQDKISSSIYRAFGVNQDQASGPASQFYGTDIGGISDYTDPKQYKDTMNFFKQSGNNFIGPSIGIYDQVANTFPNENALISSSLVSDLSRYNYSEDETGF